LSDEDLHFICRRRYINIAADVTSMNIKPGIFGA
jgi:hypothetical protein